MTGRVWFGATMLAICCLLPDGAARGSGAMSAAFVVNTARPRSDTDRDGLPDEYELRAGSNWQLADADEDPDNDGRTNIEEYDAGTDPAIDDWAGPMELISTVFTLHTGGPPLVLSADTDSDGLPDWWEIKYHLNATWPDDARFDSDQDGWTNLREFQLGKNPSLDDRLTLAFALSPLFETDTGGRSPDADNDGLPDWWERVFFDDATSAISSANPDNDLHTNIQEYWAGTNPTDPRSVLAILDFRILNGTTTVIRWSSVQSRTYTLWKTADAGKSFAAVATNLSGNPPANTYTNTLGPASELYRVGTTLPP